MKISHKQAQLLIVFLVVVFIGIFYHPVLFSPNSYMFCTGEDGLVSYFNFAYHLQSKGEIINCSSMNYPFGEVVFYIDNAPGVVNILKVLSPIFPNIAAYSVGILNYIIFISWLFAALLFFELYRFFNIPKLGALLASVGIVFLSPQIDRIFYGHYSLGFIVFIPWILWLCLRFFEKKRKIAGFTIFFVNLWVLLIHAYFGLITVFITCGFALFYFERKQTLKFFIQALTFILPLLIYFTLSKLCDHHTMREKDTWGYFYFNSSLLSFFIPRGGFLHEYFHLPLKSSYEGDAYIGVFACFALSLLLYRFVKEVFAKKTIFKTDSLLREKPLKFILLIGISGALIAMSFPFWFGLQKFFDLMPFLKQFRSIGRFAWVFYYSITFLAPIIVYNFLNKSNLKKHIVSILFYGMLLIPISQAFFKHHKLTAYSVLEHNCLYEKYLSEEEKQMLDAIEQDKYQAIIPLPYFHNGSNCYFKFDNPYTILKLNYIISFYKKIPSFGVRLSRTSLLDTRIIGSLFLPPYCERVIANYIEPEKPILVVVDKTTPLLFYEKELLKQATVFYESEHIALYHLSTSALINTNYEQLTALHLVKPIYYDGFATYKNGVLSIAPKQYYTIFDSRDVELEPDSLYRLSFWTYIGDDDSAFKTNVTFSYFATTKQLVNKEQKQTGVGMIMHEDWGRIDYLFSIPAHQYLLVEVKSDGIQSYFAHVMLQKESENTVIENDNTELRINNFKTVRKN